MTRPQLVATTAVAIAAILFGRAGAAAPRVMQFPPPELALGLDPIPFTVSRPLLDPPPPPRPLRPRVVDLGPPPLPRFDSAVTKPFPSVADPGALSCALAAVVSRAPNLARCGTSRALRGELERAREALEESLALEPVGSQSAVASLWLAEVGFRESRYDDAERRYRTALAQGLTHDLAAHAELGLGWIALRRGDPREAQVAIGRALSRPPVAPLLPLLRFLDGVVRLLMGQAGEALSRWQGLERIGAPPGLAPEVVFWHGVVWVQRGEPEPALQALTHFLGTTPSDHPLRRDALAQRGWAQLVRGTASLALTDFATAAAPPPPAELARELHVGLVRAYLALGRYGDARDEIGRLAGEEPESSLVLRLLLYTAEQALRREATVEAIDTYRRLRARSAEPRLRAYATYRIAENLARLIERPGGQGDRREAEAEYRRLRDEGGDEGLAQRAAYQLALLALRDQRPGDTFREGEALLRAGVIPELRERVLILTAEAAARIRAPNRASTLYRLALAENPISAGAASLRLALGWALLDDGEADLAVQEWQHAAEVGDAAVGAAAHAAIAKVSLDRGHDSQAISALRALGQLVPPGRPEALLIELNRGILLARAGDYGAAIDDLKPLLSRDAAPDLQVLIRRTLGIALYHHGQYAEAQGAFLDAARREPGAASNWLGAGLAAFWQNRLEDADRALMRARLTTEPRIAISAAYALVLARRDDPGEFERRAGTFIATYPAHPHSGILTSKLVADALARGQGERAYAWTTWLVREQPGSEHVEDALVSLAEAEYGQPALARQVYRDVVARVRDRDARLRGRIGLARAALTLGRPVEAREALAGFLEEAAPHDGRLPWVYDQLIRVHEMEGRPDRVLATLETFVARFPDESSTPAKQLRRGELLLQERRWDAAQQALEAARDSGEPSVAPRAHLRLGEFLRARGDHEAAIEHYLGATYLYPDTSWAALGLQGAAQGYLILKMPREARIVLEKLTARSGLDPGLAQWAREELNRFAPPKPVTVPPARALRSGTKKP